MRGGLNEQKELNVSKFKPIRMYLNSNQFQSEIFIQLINQSNWNWNCNSIPLARDDNLFCIKNALIEFKFNLKVF